jgi:hypothetical protein
VIVPADLLDEFTVACSGLRVRHVT